MPKPRIEPPIMNSGGAYFNGIIYGNLGVGKTHFAATANEFEETSPSLFVDIDFGTRTFANIQNPPDIARPATFKELQDLYLYLVHENDQYRSIVLDPLNELQRKFSLGVILMEMEKDEEGYTDLVSSPIPDRREWNRTGLQMKKLIRAFKDLAYHPDETRRIHVIMTSLERLNDKRLTVSPMLYGSLGEECGAMVDFLFRMSEHETPDNRIRRHLLMRKYRSEDDGVEYFAKARGCHGLPKGIWNPTVKSVFEAIKKSTREIVEEGN